MARRGFLEKQRRTVVPRWRPSIISARTDDQLSSPRQAGAIIEKFDKEALEKEYQKSIREFSATRNAWFAGDLLVDAISRSDEDIAERVAKFVIADDSGASNTLVGIAREYLQSNDDVDEAEDGPRRAVSELRKGLNVFPRNAIAWADLAYYLNLAGKFNLAHRAIRTAISIAPMNRFVLRSAARFYIHRNEPDRAHELLRTSPATAHDPWLLAAEIAVATAAERRSRLIKPGRLMVKDKAFHPRHISELASAIGTAELDAGTPRKQIRSMFDASLKKPTENSIAQAGWVSREHTGITDNPSFSDRSDVNEARAWELFVSGHFLQAREYAERWLDDQPFSARPAQLASWVMCSLLEEYERAIKILTIAIKPNPRDSVILNNLAFAHANLNEINTARRYVIRARVAAVTENERLCAMATAGFIAFRQGDDNGGRNLYLEVIERAQHDSSVDERISEMAWLYLAHEECLAETKNAPVTTRTALEVAAKSRDITVKTVLLHHKSALLSHLGG